MRHKQQSAGLAWVLSAEAFVIQCRDYGFTGTRGSYHKIAVIPSHGALRFQFIQNLLLVRIRQNVQRIDVDIVYFAVLFCLQSTNQAFPLPFLVVFEFVGVPVAFKCGGNFINGFR